MGIGNLDEYWNVAGSEIRRLARHHWSDRTGTGETYEDCKTSLDGPFGGSAGVCARGRVTSRASFIALRRGPRVEQVNRHLDRFGQGKGGPENNTNTRKPQSRERGL